MTLSTSHLAAACFVQIVQSCTRISARASGSVVQIDVEQLEAVLRNEVEQMMNELNERFGTGGGACIVAKVLA